MYRIYWQMEDILVRVLRMQSLKKLGCSLEIAKRNELHKFVGMPKKWVVERSFAWLEKIVSKH